MVDKFIISDKILGKGSFGSVYLGEDIINQNYLAFKTIPKDIAENKKRLDALNNEINISLDIKGENIVNSYGIVEISNQSYIISEYCNAGDLTQYLRFYGRFDESLTQNVLRQILYGLNILHEKKIIHHDIKPANVLVDFSNKNSQLNDKSRMKDLTDKVKEYMTKNKGELHGENNVCEMNFNENDNVQINDEIIEYILRNSTLKLSDFGFSKVSYADNEIQRCGSPAYVCKEVFIAKSIEVIENVKVDIWALGILAYELYFGKRPFEKASNNTELYKLIDEGVYEINLNECKEVSKEFLGFLNMCLQNNPDERATANELMYTEFITGDVNNFHKLNKYNFLEAFEGCEKIDNHHYIIKDISKIFMNANDDKKILNIFEL